MPDDLLSALIAYLKATTAVTSLLSTPDAITTDLQNWGADIPYLLIEGYTEILPGESTEDEPVDLSIFIYAGTIDAVRLIATAVTVYVDSPNINPNSMRPTPFTWTGGSEEGVMRDKLKISREPLQMRKGILAYEGRIDYEIYVTPNQ